MHQSHQSTASQFMTPSPIKKSRFTSKENSSEFKKNLSENANKLEYEQNNNLDKNSNFESKRKTNKPKENKSNEEIAENLKLLKSYLKTEKITLEKFMRMFDKNLDSNINYREFKSGFRQIGLILEEHEFIQFFNFFDRDHSESISKNEFFELLFQTEPEEKNSLLEDKSRKIDVFDIIRNIKKVLRKKYGLNLHIFFDHFLTENRDGEEIKIKLEEFRILIDNMSLLLTYDEIKEVFNFFSEKDEKKKMSINLKTFYDFLLSDLNAMKIRDLLVQGIKEKNILVNHFFDKYDSNKDGYINETEFRGLIKTFQEDINWFDMGEFFDILDINKDGRISLAEIEKFLNIRSYSFYEEGNKNEIVFLVNCLRNRIRNRGINLEAMLSDFDPKHSMNISNEEFINLVKDLNVSLKMNEIQVMYDYFKQFKKNENDEYFNYSTFFFFVNNELDFFRVFKYVNDYLFQNFLTLENLFEKCDSDNDKALSFPEFSNMMAKIQIKHISQNELMKIFEYFTIKPHKSHILLSNFKLFFDEPQNIFENFFLYKQNTTIDFTSKRFKKQEDFQSLKDQSFALQKYLFFKYSSHFPFLKDFYRSIITTKNKMDDESFEKYIKSAFELGQKNKNSIPSVNFRIGLLKLNNNNVLQINLAKEFVDKMVDFRTNKCDLEEFMYLINSFDLIFPNKKEELVKKTKKLKKKLIIL